MKYAFNIEVNFKKDLINFYEWEEFDNIEILKKTPIIKVSNEIYNLLLNKNIRLETSFLKDTVVDREFNIVFVNDYDSVCINFNDKGEVNELSKITLEDELEILELIYRTKEFDLKYEIINENNISYNPLTRKDQKISALVKKELNKIKNNKDLIDYLSLELFNDNFSSNSYKKFSEKILKSQSQYKDKFYKIIKHLNNV